MGEIRLHIGISSNAEDVKREFSSLNEEIDRAILSGIRDAVEIMEEEGARTMGRSQEHARAAIKTDVVGASPGILIKGEVYTEDAISYWRQVGTGLYGPYNQRIEPTEKRALAFNWGGRHMVLRSVAGARPNHWFDLMYERSKDRAKNAVFSSVERVVE